MKITESQLRSIVRSELNAVMKNEGIMDTISQGFQKAKSAVGLGPEKYYRLLAEMVAATLIFGNSPEANTSSLGSGLENLGSFIQDKLGKDPKNIINDIQASSLTPEEKKLASLYNKITQIDRSPKEAQEILNMLKDPNNLPNRLKGATPENFVEKFDQVLTDMSDDRGIFGKDYQDTARIYKGMGLHAYKLAKAYKQLVSNKQTK